MEVLAWSEHLTAGETSARGTRQVNLAFLLKESDIVTIHMRLSERTHGLIGGRELAMRRPDALLVNILRAAVVDEDALVTGLHGGTIGGAALDPYGREPLTEDAPILSAPTLVVG